MLRSKNKFVVKKLLVIFCCFCLVIVFNFVHLAQANPSAQIQFTADTIIDLSGLDTTLYALEDSECDSISVSGTSLTVDIPSASAFTLATASNNVLRLTPSGGSLTLVFDSANFSSGYVSQWTEQSATAGLETAHLVGTSQANTWFSIKVDNAAFNSYQSNASGEITFTYDGGYSAKTFTIEQDTTAPTSFSLVSPVNNATTNDSTPTFSWNASSVPDLNAYQLYIDGSLHKSVSSSTISTTADSALSCGSHTWYIKAVDKAGNSTASSTFNLTVDYCPPTGTTLSFGTITTNSITVQVSGASDAVSNLHSLPYYFQETSTSDTSSWQAGTSWAHSSLSANTQYSYQVKAKDNADTPNASSFTTAQSKYTLIQTPTGISFDNVSVNSLTISATGTLANLSSGSSGLYFDETLENSGGADSTWTQTNSYQNTGLSENTQYTYKVKARNGDSTETSYTSTSSSYTLADTPTNLAVSSSINNTATLTVDSLPNASSDSSAYYFYRSGDEANHNSGWIQTNFWQDSDFTCNTNYTWYAKYRNGDGVETSEISVTSTSAPYACGVAFIPPPATTTGRVTTSPAQSATTIKYFDPVDNQTFTKVEIPAQATEGAAIVAIEPKTSSQVNQTTNRAVLPTNKQIVSNLVADYQAKSGGQAIKEFKKPITIIFRYQEEEVKQYQEETLKIYYFDETLKQWIALPDSQVDVNTNAITATATHFTLFAVMGELKTSAIESEQKEEQPEETAKTEETSTPGKAKEAETKKSVTFERELRYGAKGKDVVKLQDMLKNLKLFPKDVLSTGYFGVTTLKAVNRYQQKVMNITPCNCGVGAKTKAYLNEHPVEFTTEKYTFTQDLKYNSRGEEVKQLQIKLKQEQFFPHWIKSTGWFGPITLKAVRLFQKFHNILEDFVGPLTRKSLNKQRLK